MIEKYRDEKKKRQQEAKEFKEEYERKRKIAEQKEAEERRKRIEELEENKYRGNVTISCENCIYYDGELHCTYNENDPLGRHDTPRRLADSYHCYYFWPTSEAEDKANSCFMVTAVMEYKHKGRDCEELNKARRFRDSYMMSQPDGKKWIEDYYVTAPKVVKVLKERNDTEAYKIIYNYLIQCDKHIDNGENREALELYFKMFEEMKKRCNIK